MQNISHYAIPIALVALIVYRRSKRSIGFQKLRPGRLKFRLVVFGLIGLLILSVGFMHPIHFIAYALGLGAGLLLGREAIRHTRFEQRVDGWYARTHIWVELTVLALFLGRIAYRIIAMMTTSAGTTTMNPNDPMQMTRDPWTAGIFFVIISYYMLYYGYLLREERKLEKAAVPAEVENPA
ncbi:hypothetical protein B5M42_020145 [Paenibacillus athensensis]|uniref:DUF1453 domain-containing protein n=1 Tax=Paenibacillus athensensis TaxID=1967502 RepID=A0A4Y8Q046_9BACL|nr:hypothetical protein [Paenibacillus athensensis]MCD1261120.1 hypothetical protein [Paenibacillus athensensis]